MNEAIEKIRSQGDSAGGVIECVDNVVSKIPEEMELQRALLKSRKVRPLLRLGNYGQLSNLVDNEIMPILEKYLANSLETGINTCGGEGHDHSHCHHHSEGHHCHHG